MVAWSSSEILFATTISRGNVQGPPLPVAYWFLLLYIHQREKIYIKKEGSTSDYVCVYNRILHHRECRESPQRTTCYYYSRRSRTASNKPRRLRWVSRPGVCACVGLSLLLYHPPNIYLLLRIYPLSLLRPAQGSVCHGLPLRRQVSPN